MFFSLGKCFIAGTSLSVVGVAALSNTKTRSEQPLAMIPVLFGIQPSVAYDFSKAWTLTVPQQPPALSTAGKLVTQCS